MSFWKFGFAGHAQSNISTILAGVPSAPSTPGNGLDSLQENHSWPLVITLEQLLEEDELIQECKTGQAKLADFLARPVVLRRLLEYVSGSAFDHEVPDIPEEQEKYAKRKQKFSHVAAEILVCNIHLVSQEIYSNLYNYMYPFWNYVLDRSPQETTKDMQQLSYWAKVNSHFLSDRPAEMLDFVRTQAGLVPRFVKHINSAPIVDVMFRIISLEIHPQGQGIIDHLSDQNLVPLLLDCLSPSHSTYTHLSVSDFLKAVINFCSTAAANAGNAEFAPPTNNQHQAQTKWGQVSQQQHAAEMKDDINCIWPSMRLLRDVASRDSLRLMLRFMLDDFPIQSPTSNTTSFESNQNNSEESSLQDRSLSSSSFDFVTPRHEKTADETSFLKISIPMPGIPTSLTPSSSNSSELATSISSSPAGQEASTSKVPISSNPILLPTEFPPPDVQVSPTAESATSSLVHCLSIMIDLIRKINSDFNEQQILHYLKKYQSREGVKSANIASGPSIVDLSCLLTEVGARINDLNVLLVSPRSDISPLSTSLGPVQPLRLERFRICELYAEMLHCSNMALMDRRGPDIPIYDKNGKLEGGIESLALLERTLLANGSVEEEEQDEPVLHSSTSSTTDLDSVATSTYKSAGGDTSAGSLAISTALANVSLESADSTPVSERDSSNSPQTARTAVPLTINGTDDFATGASTSKTSLPNGFPPMKSTLTPGRMLKSRFLTTKVHIALLDLFFSHPWNNFLHNVVYDVIQQTFNARKDIDLNRQLCLSLFLQGRLTDRILQAQRDNDVASTMPKRKRLGYMGHLSLIAEEVVKLFVHFQEQIYHVVEPTVKQPDWCVYVETSLRETRENDLQQLGGGISIAVNDTISTASGLSDDDDEFPMSTRNGRQKAVEAVEAVEAIQLTSPQAEPIPMPSNSSKSVLEKPAPNDKFARYLAQQISSDLPDKFSSSSDEEDEENIAEWLNSTGFDPKDADFHLREDGVCGPLLEYTHSDATNQSRSDDFGDFSPAPLVKKDPFEPVSRPNLTAADWNSEFKSSFTFSSEGSADLENPFASADDEDDDDDDDDFGAFTNAPALTVPEFTFEQADTRDFDDAFNPLSEVSNPEREKIRSDGLIDVVIDDQGTTVTVPEDEVNKSRVDKSRSVPASTL